MTNREQHLEAFKKVLDEMYELAEMKSSQYAKDDDWLANYLAPEQLGVGRETYMLARALEKMERLKNLYRQNKSYDEELMDIACIFIHLIALK